MLRVLHVIETIAPEEGGPPRVVASLAAAQRRLGIDAQILCGDRAHLADHARYWQAHVPGFPTDHVHAVAPRSGSLAARAMALWEWLKANLRDFEVVHIHQLWRPVPSLAGLASRRLAVPYIIAPHTSLSPWALAQKRPKKQLARWLAWDGIFAGASAFHALNVSEASEIREFAGAEPTAIVVPNGVSLAEFSDAALEAPSGTIADPLIRAGTIRPYVLFFARLHTMKGPDILLEAFASIAFDHPGLRLVFAGPDFGMLRGLLSRVAQLGLIDRVHFLGLVSGSDRVWLLRNALCLSQPSRDEGFSLSILEAMASRCPVVISDRCKFPEVGRSGAGIVVPLSIPDLAAALGRYAIDPARRLADGSAARRLIEKSYTWEIVAEETRSMYEKCTAPAALSPDYRMR
jgi:glycosyltransferase involved in cell wall biosynthesis